MNRRAGSSQKAFLLQIQSFHDCDGAQLIDFPPGAGVTSSRENKEEQFTFDAFWSNWKTAKKDHLCSHMTHELSIVKDDRLIKVAEGAATLL